LKGHIDDSDFVDSDFVDSATNIINEHQLPSKDQIFQLSITVPDWMFRMYAKSSRLKSLQNQPTKIKTQTKYQEVTTIYTSDIYFSLTVPPHRSVAGVKSFLQRIFACMMTNLTVLLHCRLVNRGNINISTLFGLLELLFKRPPQSSNLKMGNDSHLG
jgi:hypothetical protein